MRAAPLLALALLWQRPPADPFPVKPIDAPFEAIAPDGTFVVIHKPTRTQVVLVDLTTKAERVVADGANWQGAAVSFDGARVAYLAASASGRTTEIRVVTIATGDVKTLATDASGPPFWTLKNDVCYPRANPARFGTDWLLVPAAGGEPKKLYTTNQDTLLGLSPDAAFVILQQRFALVLDELTTGEERSIAGGLGVENAPAFSPDGKLLAFVSDRGVGPSLYVVALDRTPARNPVRVGAVAGTQPRVFVGWTADGRLAARAPAEAQGRVWSNVTYAAVTRLMGAKPPAFQPPIAMSPFSVRK